MPLNAIASQVTSPEQSMVVYKFRSPDLGEYFEALNPEQAHIALEGALNIIFSKPTQTLEEMMGLQPMGGGVEATEPEPVLEEESEEPQSDEENQIDHEYNITSATVLALFDHQQGILAEAAGITEMVPVDDPENSPLYQQMSDIFTSILNKLSDDITEDKYNQDVITLLGEMEFFNRIELFTYQYDPKSEQLSVTVAATSN